MKPQQIADSSTDFPFAEDTLVPATVAVCPYCSGTLTVKAEAWEEGVDGTIVVIGIDMVCANESDDDENDHTALPYVHWLPVSNTIRDWLNGQLLKGGAQ